jgi:hypothetical protein
MWVRRLKTGTTVRTATLVLRSRQAIPMSKDNQRLRRSLVAGNNLIGPLYLRLCIYAECSGFGKTSASPAAANSSRAAMANGTRVCNQLGSAAKATVACLAWSSAGRTPALKAHGFNPSAQPARGLGNFLPERLQDRETRGGVHFVNRPLPKSRAIGFERRPPFALVPLIAPSRCLRGDQGIGAARTSVKQAIHKNQVISICFDAPWSN